MNSKNIALIATAITAALALSACGLKRTSGKASSPVDSAAAAESDLNKSGCTFQETSGQTAADKKTELTCKDIKGVDKTKAIATYISRVSASMKEKGRMNTDKLQAKLNAASAKLADQSKTAASPDPSTTSPSK